MNYGPLFVCRNVLAADAQLYRMSCRLFEDLLPLVAQAARSSWRTGRVIKRSRLDLYDDGTFTVTLTIKHPDIIVLYYGERIHPLETFFGKECYGQYIRPSQEFDEYTCISNYGYRNSGRLFNVDREKLSLLEAGLAFKRSLHGSAAGRREKFFAASYLVRIYIVLQRLGLCKELIFLVISFI